MKKLFKRENYLKKIRGFYDDVDMIKVITGVRRCGKSSLMELISDELTSRGIEKENIIFIHLDKRPYKSIKTSDQLEKIIDEKTLRLNGIKYLFIDEIQNVTGFEEVINAYREEGEYSIFITGSNSYLLSGDLATKLTGRYIEFEMTTLSFEEYLGMKKFYEKEISLDKDEEFINYILEGGFPLTLKYDSFDDKRLYVDSVIDEIYEKDIRKNNKIRKKELFKKIQTYIINNFGATTSVESICKYLKKKGDNVSKNTVYNYLNILESAKIISKCERFDMKSKRSLSGEEKYYLSDLSFYFAKNTDNRINYGPVLENVIYNYLKSKGYKISIGKIGKFEVDFIIRNNMNDYAYIQVARTIDNDNYDENGKNITEEREYRSLENISDGYSKYLLTMDKLLQKRSGIKHLNILDMMINNEELL
ncbi:MULTISPECIES: ATP-binding protein [Coprobacillaceae]|uniref:ATP-binding protein n=1 Tax=Coprobacillaceae TaxID=2810280 RepID=UPI000E490703|nr:MULTISPECIES: ATP-binding protein [Coprobacillaceae]RHM61870.1 ATP-binding protein [Coprobacillus sp. AF33-1AC]RHS94703.1 ATP-binding protein [Erysipelatoclostridium sp. AM42-17]